MVLPSLVRNKYLPTESVSQGCHHKAPQSGRLRAAETHCLTELEATSVRLKCWPSQAPSETCEGLFPCSGLLAVSDMPCLETHPSSPPSPHGSLLMSSHDLPLCVSLSVSRFSLFRKTPAILY